MPSLRPRITPSFVVAVLALVLVSTGVGYAAGQINSADIRDNSIRSRDVRNGTLAGDDLRDRAIPRRKLDRTCPPGHSSVFAGCVLRVGHGRSSFLAAVDDCNRRNGRLPTMHELHWIATHDEYRWADGNPGQYEFSGDFTTVNPSTPVARDQGGNVISNASAQLFWHHCVIAS